MARYIDADEIDYKFIMVGMDENAGYRAVAFESDIDEMPTANVVLRSELAIQSFQDAATIHSLQNELSKAKSEVAREIFENLYKLVASKIPMKIRPIFKDDRDFDAGVVDGKRDAFIEVLVLLAELKKKYADSENG